MLKGRSAGFRAAGRYDDRFLRISLLCIVTAHPKMVDTKDVTPHQTPVNISMKDLPIQPNL